ncbi:CsiV family protein [Oceanospirillum sp.]|uniref:CsiV family protein n=1 Tax=Oceanospirillum sp. TaxID=2021254 RepID=UPI003A8F10A8
MRTIDPMMQSQKNRTAFLTWGRQTAERAAGLCILSTALLAMMVGSPVLAADSTAGKPAPRYYSVEMIIFSYEEQDEGLSENWPENIQVELPASYLQLYRPSDITSELLRVTQQEVQTRVKTNSQGETELVETPVGVVPLSSQQRADIKNNRLPNFFYMPKKKMQLNAQYNRLKRRSGLRVMYHEAWSMPVYDRENSTPILIQGGEQFDNLFELEGSIEISVARYLHLDTNLYLREFEANHNTDQANPADFNGRLSHHDSSVSVLQQNTAVPNPSLALLGFRQYRVDTVIPLKQSRRMRSRDLHYIDNPRYGILIQLLPYNPEEEPIPLR